MVNIIEIIIDLVYLSLKTHKTTKKLRKNIMNTYYFHS